MRHEMTRPVAAPPNSDDHSDPEPRRQRTGRGEDQKHADHYAYVSRLLELRGRPRAMLSESRSVFRVQFVLDLHAIR
jgi:hypothetical protein